ncbi:hypothetical protein HanIR_Chr13g0621991 [Helianthus annuus]|nr:hypothetical protein HanIR_Chr13g0621991 [Helianthus annuus]
MMHVTRTVFKVEFTHNGLLPNSNKKHPERNTYWEELVKHALYPRIATGALESFEGT